MTSAYGPLDTTPEWMERQKVLDRLIPLSNLYLRDATPVRIVQLRRECTKLCEQAQLLLNLEIEAGSYPQDKTLDMEGFCNYYLSYFAFACIEDVEHHNDDSVDLLGSFYIKPNFPGRSSHICNTGFLVQPQWRRKGVGSVMEKAFSWLSFQLFFRAAFFNLVYVDNEASVGFWKKHGYQIVGVIPCAKKVKRDDGTISYVDALNMFKEFCP
ncbi:N-acetyltransferase [Galdieria sulphuraria]|uniref:N-acetyltransferase n=1 Tax=Galdieria sulphuraria TaxID=130081 RepID=M2Y3K2_GALSU|nr:N-acetyltransferase [Galdieria sulphuraria]EME30558.1 N-acetyltransferase [Galdieria sulphuraria]|eukprot:XP_005707078.1 N-acetyltransferase [Galdieria sulphuraria]